MKQQENLTQEQIQEVIRLLDEGNLLSPDEQQIIGDSFASLNKFMADNKDKVDAGEDLEKINIELNEAWNNSRQAIENIKYTLSLNGEEYKFVIDLLTTLEFPSVDEILIAEEVDETILSQIKVKFPVASDFVANYSVGIKQLTNFYHVLTLYKAKGLYSTKTKTFSNVMKKTGMISLIFSYFNQLSRDMAPIVYQFSLGLSKAEEEEVPAGTIRETEQAEA
jgi:hypothetical protein